MDCLFCGIASQTIPSDIVFQDDNVVVFRDIAPQAPTHLVIIPRKHIATLNDLDADDGQLVGQLAITAKNLAAELGFAEEGYRVVMNCNGHGGQTVFHIHMHLLAGRGLGWPPG